MKITIDPGHTKNVNKGVIKGYYEGNAMFKLSAYLAEELRKYENTEVFLTRGENDNPTLTERGETAIETKSGVFISMHSNSTSESEDASYVCGFYSVKRKDSKELCAKIVSAVVNAMRDYTDAWDRGALTKETSSGTDYYGVIRSSVSGDSEVKYSFIIEHGFHSNPKQCKFLLDEENLKMLAFAEASVLAKYLDLKKKDEFEVERVQIPDKSDLNDYIKNGEYYFNGYPSSVKNQPPSEIEKESFVLNVTTCFYQDIPYAIQRIYYVGSGKEYIRGMYVKDGKTHEIDRDWSRK